MAMTCFTCDIVSEFGMLTLFVKTNGGVPMVHLNGKAFQENKAKMKLHVLI